MKDNYGALEDQKRSTGEQIWLHYYNQVLYDKGMITEDERNRMTNRIDARKGGTLPGKKKESCR